MFWYCFSLCFVRNYQLEILSKLLTSNTLLRNTKRQKQRNLKNNRKLQIYKCLCTHTTRRVNIVPPPFNKCIQAVSHVLTMQSHNYPINTPTFIPHYAPNHLSTCIIHIYITQWQDFQLCLQEPSSLSPWWPLLRPQSLPPPLLTTTPSPSVKELELTVARRWLSRRCLATAECTSPLKVELYTTIVFEDNILRKSDSENLIEYFASNSFV